MKENLVEPLPVFAGSLLNGEYTLSRNVLDLEKQSGIFLILNLGMEWLFPQCVGRLLLPVRDLWRGPWCGLRAHPGLGGTLWFWVETAAVVLGALGEGLCLVPELLSDLLLAIS